MMSRRQMLAAAPLSLAGAGARIQAGCQTNAWRIQPGDFGNLLEVLGRIKGHEFDGFETGFRNLEGQFANATRAKAQIAATGLRFFGIHIFLLQYDPQTAVAPWDLIMRVADGSAALGAQRLILSGGPAADPRRKAEGLDRAGEYCRKAGLDLAYHNHDREFTSGEIEGLLSHTQPGLLHLVLDAGHAFRARADVTAFFRRHHGRIGGMHLRDFRNGEQVPLGQGEFDLRPLAAEIGKTGWSGWLLAEEERLNDGKPGDSAVEPARRHLRKIFGV
ncbi:MAG: TIM barrel protein [Acidobacteria bacterium]|nr:TIM barrel protein [Acidobacteriota bacterium]